MNDGLDRTMASLMPLSAIELGRAPAAGAANRGRTCYFGTLQASHHAR